MKIAIVDDDAEYLKYMLELISKNWQDQDSSAVFSVFSDVEELKAVISQYDVVFMDIEMPEKDGITAASELRAIVSDLMIVFVSDYDSYVWDSFQAEPLYFLRKSFLEKELPWVIKKCRDTYAARNKKLIIDTMQETYCCDIADIYYIEAQKKECNIYFDRGEAKRLKIAFSKVEEMLDKPRFLKIHRSYLVNSGHIRSLQKKQLILENDLTLPVSKYRYADVYQQYLMSQF